MALPWLIYQSIFHGKYREGFAATAEKLSAEERRVAMQKLTDDFEAAIGGIVTAAVVGDFSKRVALEGKEGFILNIGGAMNELCENVATTMEDLAQMFGALAEGDFSRRITAEYQGIFGVLKNDANSMADRIASTISEIKAVGREVANAAAEISGQHHRPVATHRGAGREPGGDLGLDGGDVRDGEEERRERHAGQPADQRLARRRRPAAARSWRRRSTPWRGSRNPRARSPTSSA